MIRAVKVSAVVFLLAGMQPGQTATMSAQDIVASVETQRDQAVAFTELRMNPLFAKPLKLSGTVEFTSDGALHKLVESPFKELLSISSESIVLERDGTRRVMSMRKSGAMFGVYKGMHALLAGDAVVIAQLYQLELLAEGAAWSIRLVPLEAGLAKFVASMTVKGEANRVTFLRTEQADGSWQELVFDQPQSSSVPP
jgi:hypothetical protein